MKLCHPCCTLSLMLIVVAMMSGLARAAEKWVVYDGFDGPGKGKKIVLIAGDDEYRSEEGLPLLGKILAKHHGFTCTMLFSQDDDGTINPGNQKNIPGLEALEDADLMIMLLRFRNLRLIGVDPAMNLRAPVLKSLDNKWNRHGSIEPNPPLRVQPRTWCACSIMAKS